LKSLLHFCEFSSYLYSWISLIYLRINIISFIVILNLCKNLSAMCNNNWILENVELKMNLNNTQLFESSIFMLKEVIQLHKWSTFLCFYFIFNIQIHIILNFLSFSKLDFVVLQVSIIKSIDSRKSCRKGKFNFYKPDRLERIFQVFKIILNS
jgi:hypothetical protein